MSEPAQAVARNDLSGQKLAVPVPVVEEVGVPSNIPGSPELSPETVDSPSAAPGEPRFSKEEYHAKAIKHLALLLFWALFLMFAAHLTTVICLAHNKPNSVEEITRVFSTWVPVFAGLFGSAATFYFTQGRK